MWSRLSRRGLAIALAIAVVRVVSPTAVPLHVVRAWSVARVAAHDGDTLVAGRALGDLQRSSAWMPSLRTDAIRLALANGNGSLALELLERAPASGPTQVPTACWQAEARAMLGEWRSAAERLTTAESSDCTYLPGLLKALALREIGSGNLPNAISILRSLASLYPQDAEPASLLGACLALEDPGAALAALELAASLSDPLAADLAAALRALPQGDDAASLAAAGQVFLRHAQWPMAAEAFRRLVTLEPQNAAAHAYFGMALDQQGSDGLTELETAARLEPTFSVAQSLLGLHWQLQDQPQKAIPHHQLAVELEPENSAFRASLAAARAEAGDVQAALAEYRQAAQLQPANPVFWRLLAAFSIAQELELATTGLPAARNALALDPDDSDALDLAGYAHFLLGDRATAERLAVRTLRLDPLSASARLHYGLLLSADGRIGEARAQLAAAADLGGDNAIGQLAQRALTQLGN